MIKKYNHSFIEAVVDLFPELQLERSKFSTTQRIFFYAFGIFYFFFFTFFIVF